MTELNNLPDSTREILLRRAQSAGVSLSAQIRAELIALAQRRVPVDSVVEFLRAERPAQLDSGIDSAATALVDYYELPARAWTVLASRAAANGTGFAEYLRAELISLARRRTLDDDLLEFQAALAADDRGPAEAAEIAAAIRYARAID